MALISIIIPCFNAEAWIDETLKSVYCQSHVNREIIVVDDGSTDLSAEIIQQKHPEVRLLQTANQGPSRARNLGTSEARGEFIQYLDADDLLAQNKLHLQLEQLMQSSADVAYGDWQSFTQHDNGTLVYGEKLVRQMSYPEIDLFTDFWCPPAAYLFRRSIVEKIGGWNERLPVIQDARFALDCALYGGTFAYCPELVAYYRTHAAGSVSTRNPEAFVQDCLRNALEIEDWWAARGGLNEKRFSALLKVYGYVARASYATDKVTFETAYGALKRLQPGYVPASPKALSWAARIMGYRQAEMLAFWWRSIKKSLPLPAM